jgi:hypothetical protein
MLYYFFGMNFAMVNSICYTFYYTIGSGDRRLPYTALVSWAGGLGTAQATLALFQGAQVY